MSRFVTFEGVEGSGKSTASRKVFEELQRQGVPVIHTREPGGCPVADQIRRILLDASNAAIVPMTELLLYFAARAQHVAEVISPALEQGRTVICDRFSDSTFAYQGYARGLDLSQIRHLDAIARGGISPDLTIIFDLPVEVGLARAMSRMGTDRSESRFEEEALSFHQRVRDGFLDLSRSSNHYRVIDATLPQEEVAAQCLELVLAR